MSSMRPGKFQNQLGIESQASTSGDWQNESSSYLNYTDHLKKQQCGTKRTHSEQKFRRGANGTSCQYDSSDTDSDQEGRSYKRARYQGGPDRNFGKRQTKKNKIIYPMRIPQLRTLIQKTPSDIILTLVEERSGFSELLKQEVSDDVVILLVKLLSTAISLKIHKENQNYLITMFLTSRFFSEHLLKFISRNGKKSNFDEQLFSNIGNVCYIIAETMPESALEGLQCCIATCEESMNIREQLKLAVPPEAKSSFKSIQDKFLEVTKKQMEIEQQEGPKKKFVHDDNDYIYELSDFRKISIIPSVDEITGGNTPLICRIITHGEYKDLNHYLDTQFRLLREDFVQPLRRGITEYLRTNSNKNYNHKIKDIRVYENVCFLKPSFGKSGVSYVVYIGNLKKICRNSSKCLMYGSLVCLSADRFKTTLFGTVSEKNDKDLQQGILTLFFENEFETQKMLNGNNLKLSYTMVESQAYYEAYKHVLMGLQNVDADTLPLQNYIVKVQQNLELPKYIDVETTYDLSCILPHQLKMKLLNLNVRKNIDPQHEASDDEPQSTLHIQVQNLDTWPSSDELGLDDSQRKALHLALSSSMAVIQGPPGTGKTYVGLKIAKVLLHNRQIWREDKKGPILVICYTNHALDQFLEGMLRFTRHLVRVGSRSKNEKLKIFNIRNIRQNLRSEKIQEKNIFYNMQQMQQQLQEIRGTWEEVKGRFKLFKTKIIHEHSLHVLKEFGDEFQSRLKKDFQIYYRPNKHNIQPDPESYLCTWLGLDMDREWVIDDRQIDDLMQSKSNIKGMKKISTKQKSKTILKEQDKLAVCQTKTNVDDDDDKKLENLIEVEDIDIVEENRRILDTEVVEELLPIKDNTQEIAWALDIAALYDPSRQIYESEIQNHLEYMYWLYCTMTKKRQEMAYGELNKLDFMDEEKAKEEMQLNLWDMSLENRWCFYRLIIEKLRNLAKSELETLPQQFNRIAKRMREVEAGEELSIFAKMDVIGMTTTGAAKYREVLQALNPTIVIVEEAAEVLESHVVTSLASGTQHLILIGDHKQLRPKPTVYTLGKDYNLDVSLFERMINNKIQFESLKIQHRMRPEISRLLVPLIYDSLEDHPSVRKYPAIKGTACSVYFINHSVKEDVLPDTKSHSNQHEAEYLVAFCQYLLQQGYLAKQITILTAYGGQLHSFKNLMMKNIFNGVRVSSVDNFQGEENDIVLLSFVRNNDDEKIGFLNIENRVNVALSRARHGMFCMGNFKLFAAKCELWRRLVSSLERDDLIGEGVEIVCQNHSDSVHKIVNPVDFKKFAPEGGCLKTCGKLLPCQHNCNRVCHFQEHGICYQPCRKTCLMGHLCTRKCYMICRQCEVIVDKKLTRCQHVHQIACYIDPEKYLCKVIVERELPDCKHLNSMSCYQNPNNVLCQKPCQWRLEKCGHQCNKNCHVLNDPEHLNFKCKKQCTKVICDRNHKCQRLCYENCTKCSERVKKKLACGHTVAMKCSVSPDLHRCILKCERMLPCGHKCPKKCSEECGGCTETLVKKLPRCAHSIPVSCSADLELIACTETCERALPCGHPCQRKCSEPCKTKCTNGVCIKANCGHIVEVPCQVKVPEIINRYCTFPCNKMLPNCEHLCKGTCGDCRQGRVHIPCKEKCGRLLVCGHICTYPCGQWCPPCTQKCQNKCKHSKCFQECGNSCTMCKERCSWECKHKQCNKYCGELCDRISCDKPCPKRLVCGHLCVGLCGESCPPLCRKCNFEELTEFQLYGNETDENARFVYLPDCKHTIEVEGMDNWMNMNTTETTDISVQMKCCPRCQTTVWNCPRYGNVIKSTFKDIQSVKKKLFGSYQKQRNEMNRLLRILQTDCVIFKHFKKKYEELRRKLVRRCVLHQNSTAAIENQINILKRMGKLKEKFTKNNVCTVAKEFADYEFNFLIGRLFILNERIGSFELTQIITEIERITLYVEMLEVEAQCQSSGETPEAKQNLDKVKEIFALGNSFDHETITIIKTHLEAAAIRKGLGISETEKIMIVQAMNLTPGHWYKCPNGHVYVIGNCGGAMEVARCSECGSKIGGERHRLLDSNAHAGEMDESRHPAWSEAANLANYEHAEFH